MLKKAPYLLLVDLNTMWLNYFPPIIMLSPSSGVRKATSMYLKKTKQLDSNINCQCSLGIQINNQIQPKMNLVSMQDNALILVITSSLF